MPRYDKLSILVSLILCGLVLSHVIELPTKVVTFVALGVPTTIYLSSRWFIGAILVILTGTGTDSIMRTHPHADRADWGYRYTFWGLPCTLTLLALFLLPLSPDKFFWLGGLGLTGVGLCLTLIAQYHTIDPHDRRYGAARWGVNLAVYLSVLIFCTLIYSMRARSLLSATTIALLGAALGVELLRPLHAEQRTQRIWLYAITGGALLAEVAWALNHLSLSGMAGGLFLLLVFYVITGLARQHLAGHLPRRVIAEFTIVSIIGLGLLHFV